MDRINKALKLHRLAADLDRLRFDALTKARELERGAQQPHAVSALNPKSYLGAST